MSKVVARQIVRTIYQGFMDSGEEFTREQVQEAAMNACADLAASALEGLVSGAVEAVDKAATKAAAPHQGEMFDLDGAYALGECNRIAKAHAQADHILQSLQLDDENTARVNAANARKHEEYERLLPYLGPGVRKAQAVQAYLEANPVANAG